MRYQNLILIGQSSNLIQLVMKDITADQRLIIEGLQKDLAPIFEMELDPGKIMAIFSGAESIANTGRENRTVVGKFSDLGSRVKKMLSSAEIWLQDSTPVIAFDEKFEKLKTKLSIILGKNPAILKQIDMLGEFAREHPRKTAFVIGVLTAMSSITKGVAAGAIAGYMLRGATELLKGTPLSTSIGRALKTGLVSYIAGLGVENIAGMFSDIKMDISSMPGYVELRRLGLVYQIDGNVIFHFNSVIPASMERSILEMFETSVGDIEKGDLEKGLRGLARLRDTLSGTEVNEIVDIALKQNPAIYAATTDQIANTRTMMNQLIAGIQGAMTGATATGRAKSKNIPESMIFETFLATEASLGKISAKIKKFGTNVTNKVTADKLKQRWKKSGSPTDMSEIIKILRASGVSDEIIKKSLKDAGIDQKDFEQEFYQSRVPFKSGIDEFDQKAEEAFQTGGLGAFVSYWDGVVASQEQLHGRPGLDPIGTIVSRTIKDPKTGKDVVVRFKKVSDTKWQDMNDPTARPFTPKPDFAKIADLKEMSSAGATSSGSIASVATGIGGPMMPVLRRMPAGQSFFGSITTRNKHRKRRQKRT